MEYTGTKYTSDISDVDNMDGFEFEAFCCEMLKCNDYTNVRNTQASGDYGLDVIATSKDGFICGIQCKNYQGTVGIAAVQEAKSGSDYYNCDIAIVLTNSTFTKAAIELAKKINVKLWDRRKLKELIQVFPEKKIVEEKSIEKKAIEIPDVINEYDMSTNITNWVKNFKQSEEESVGKQDIIDEQKTSKGNNIVSTDDTTNFDNKNSTNEKRDTIIGCCGGIIIIAAVIGCLVFLYSKFGVLSIIGLIIMFVIILFSCKS